MSLSDGGFFSATTLVSFSAEILSRMYSFHVGETPSRGMSIGCDGNKLIVSVGVAVRCVPGSIWTATMSDVKAAASIELDLPIAADVTAVECAGPEVRSGADGQASSSGAIFRPQLSFRECGPTGKGSDH